MNDFQSNTKKGSIAVESNEDLTGKEGYLVKIVNSSGEKKAALPSAAGDETPYFINDGAASGNISELKPMRPDEQVRLRLNGTCDLWDVIVREDETGADKGKVRKLPASAGTYTRVGIAEEDGEDEQLLLIRPWRMGEKEVVV